MDEDMRDLAEGTATVVVRKPGAYIDIMLDIWEAYVKQRGEPLSVLLAQWQQEIEPGSPITFTSEGGYEAA